MTAPDPARRPPDELREQVARAFHEAYERLAPDFGYETRRASAVPWEQVPENNRAPMVATVDAVLPLVEAATAERIAAFMGEFFGPQYGAAVRSGAWKQP